MNNNELALKNIPEDHNSPDRTPSEPSIDLEALARKVYDLLRRELRLERERLGQTRPGRLG